VIEYVSILVYPNIINFKNEFQSATVPWRCSRIDEIKDAGSKREACVGEGRLTQMDSGRKEVEIYDE
jgi:hypothetical protein